jgi:hypothetical protein
MIPEVVPVYVVDIIEEAVAATSAAVLAKIQANETEALGETMIQQLSYYKCSFDELIETLNQLDQSGEERYKKYPLVGLMRDFREQRGREAGIYCEVNLRIIIAHQTVNTYKEQDREQKVFRPVLYPIYYELMRQLAYHKMVFQFGPDEIRHDKTDRAYWGTRQQQGTDKNMLNDYVDAIEIENLTLKINFPNC